MVKDMRNMLSMSNMSFFVGRKSISSKISSQFLIFVYISSKIVDAVFLSKMSRFRSFFSSPKTNLSCL